MDVAKELGLPISTLNTLIYKRKIIEESHHQSGSSASIKLRVQSGKLADFEKVLLRWFNQCRWLHKFKLRHGITGKTVSGESGDVDCETVDDCIQNQLPDLIKGYEQKHVFNADGTGLFYNLLPSKTLAIKSDTCLGGKKSKVRLTMSLCANANGYEKLPPLIIGKSKKPRCFKNVKTLPTIT
ncbi:Tigger transposable element-derived protein 6 [Araneus ventricosus]|uniref:Tigger transposable element-derived protein 6 n=1 Tax=Araneus ventricosus TaxID=182803 RepID=A0A4Y2BF63_ARAVE|nr:Tigger transposable element-derived protein 6 [Araneus ventricosus]